mmetsp:Transcript_48321/g.149089  ORF Transcript_48321/g.149089 Transcript_48321/m.149089 type:complete len:331 (+) Transcript_48321:412-1404(+)
MLRGVATPLPGGVARGGSPAGAICGGSGVPCFDPCSADDAAAAAATAAAAAAVVGSGRVSRQWKPGMHSTRRVALLKVRCFTARMLPCAMHRSCSSSPREPYRPPAPPPRFVLLAGPLRSRAAGDVPAGLGPPAPPLLGERPPPKCVGVAWAWPYPRSGDCAMNGVPCPEPNMPEAPLPLPPSCCCCRKLAMAWSQRTRTCGTRKGKSSRRDRTTCTKAGCATNCTICAVWTNSCSDGICCISSIIAAAAAAGPVPCGPVSSSKAPGTIVAPLPLGVAEACCAGCDSEAGCFCCCGCCWGCCCGAIGMAPGAACMAPPWPSTFWASGWFE